MKENVIYNEPCLETLRKMEGKSIDCVITSPPYWQLRDYGYEGQWGLEPTFNEYLEHLWSMMDEIYRVLKDEGTVWVNLGDTYNTNSGGGSSTCSTGNKEALLQMGRNNKQDKKYSSKCLLLIPNRFAIGCIDRGWIVRNDVIWAKRNGMPESVTDRFSKKHEYMFFMVKSEKYYFDLDAVKDKATPDTSVRDRDSTKLNNTPGRSKMGGLKVNDYTTKNPGSVSDFWDIPTKPSSSKHYAVYNDSLIAKPILSGCPEQGIIYDPFMGSGSTAAAAIRANRKFIGSEMSEEYFKIANDRINPMLAQLTLF